MTTCLSLNDFSIYPQEWSTAAFHSSAIGSSSPVVRLELDQIHLAPADSLCPMLDDFTSLLLHLQTLHVKIRRMDRGF